MQFVVRRRKSQRGAKRKVKVIPTARKRQFDCRPQTARVQ